MKKLTLLFVSMLLLVGCAKIYSWNQKVTLYFETPNGPVVASGVTHVELRHERLILVGSVNPVNSDIYGEAIMVALGGDRYLFVLMPSGSTASNVYSDLRPKGSDGFRFITKQIGKEPVVLDTHRYRPDMVYFPNINDTMSAIEVTPDNFTEVLGDGYVYDKMTFGITRDDVSLPSVSQVLTKQFFDQRSSALREIRQEPIYRSERVIFIRYLGRDAFIKEKL